MSGNRMLWVLGAVAGAGVLLLLPLLLIGGANPVVVMETNMGDIKVELDSGRAPVTVDNFLRYVDAKVYDGTMVHGLNPRVAIAAGSFEPGELDPRPRKRPFPPRDNSLERGENKKHTLAMLRTADTDRASQEFFIHLKDNPEADGEDPRKGSGLAPFGRIVEGAEVVDRISAMKTRPIPELGSAPHPPVVIKSIKRVR